MNSLRLPDCLILSMVLVVLSAGCSEIDPGVCQPEGREPVLEPDYSGITIPFNIAPLNFRINEKGDLFIVTVISADGERETFRSSDGNVIFPLKEWKRIAGNSKGNEILIEVKCENKDKKFIKFDPIHIKVSSSPIDPWLCYRLLYPGYESWVEMQIKLRSTETFKEESLVENQLLDGNCINCHSFNKNSPDRFMLHVRGSKGGTYFFDGKELIRRSLRTENMTANAVYPAWHPSGKYIAFSSNKTVQSFHMKSGKNIEVTDMYSSLVIYDTEKNGMFGTKDKDTVKYMETFPWWSPQGDYLYYCRTLQVKEGYDYKSVKYDLVRKSFNSSTGEFGTAEIVYKASDTGKSVSFPSISPDGKYLVFTLHNYGTFSIWHKEADLYLLDLQTMKSEKLSINSEETESFHSWSSNGKWIVFSSKRMDGLTARPYFAYFGSSDSIGKPFVLPQKDPDLYQRLAKTFNRPELVTGKPDIGPRDFMKASGKGALKAVWTGN
jgi:Tol biopolymer transport system component